MQFLLATCAAFLTLLFSVSNMALRTVLFISPSWKSLPKVVKLRGFTFLYLLTCYFGAAVLRHHYVAHSRWLIVFFSATLYLVFLIPFFRRNLRLFSMVLLASIGVDIVMAAAGLAGVDIKDARVASTVDFWEHLAAIIGATRLYLSDRAEMRAAAAKVHADNSTDNPPADQN